MDYLERIVGIMESYSHLGQRVLDNGTRLIGHVPHVAPEAWFQSIYHPLRTEEIKYIEEDVGSQVPVVFSIFLKKCNGLSLFSDSLNIYGLRKSFARTGDAVWQPFSIKTPNIDERPRHSRSSFFFVGGYGLDGSLLYIDTNSQEVYRCKQRSAKPLNQWPSFEVMLERETERLSRLFDKEGHLLNPDQPTTP
jgi:hypothetical protein